ncbi:GNAT family N-acetyltransferase [Opitutus terrae]|uniref:GCN5-related N-acetyltransferase n=1 Tax=Opitutus terrae (strain DSM 11246 / JCM 15787 / PB90-1) TaxID=452637 RepID=B1ZX31_OPITP|nr:GNAT family N-acetyltransferase [Opitutus terrae]ACB75145.1 GCN5-related N-acetyltransferase [Opitutus terrae PB90-1]
MTDASNQTDLRFTEIVHAPEGSLASLLRLAYGPLITRNSSRWAPELAAWADFDRVAFRTPEVGRCVFLSWQHETLVGFGSFDPRAAPASARIGHHCVVPDRQHRGLGTLQLQEILRRLRGVGVIAVDAFTLDLPFFAPACHLYAKAGFGIVERTPWTRDATVQRLHFRKLYPPAS